MQLKFREDKTTQAAARLLKLAGGTMNHMKLVKLLYFLDRASLLKSGRPVSFDSYFALPHGPVLSFTLDRINEDPDPDAPSYWHRHISERRGHGVELMADTLPSDQLSEAEEALIDEIFSRYGGMSQWEIRDYSHTLPEWRDPQGSSLPILISDILAAEGFREEDIREIEETLQAEMVADRLLS
ncbi:MAG: Panacea domain-containing protein [Gemmatimonadales bacterium]